MKIKSIAELSPLIGAFLIFVGYLKLHIYYSNWNIDIYSYLDFSEILLSFLNDSNTLLFFLILLFFHAIFGVSLIKAIDNKRKKEEKQNTESKNEIITLENENDTDQESKQMKGFNYEIERSIEHKPTTTLVVLFICFLISLIIFILTYSLISLYFSFIMLLQFLILIFEMFFKGIENDSQLILSFSIAIIGFSYGLAQYDINETNKGLKIAKLYTDKNESISINSRTLILGKTNNYYILFDQYKNQTISLPTTIITKYETNVGY